MKIIRKLSRMFVWKFYFVMSECVYTPLPQCDLIEQRQSVERIICVVHYTTFQKLFIITKRIQISKLYGNQMFLVNDIT